MSAILGRGPCVVHDRPGDELLKQRTRPSSSIRRRAFDLHDLTLLNTTFAIMVHIASASELPTSGSVPASRVRSSTCPNCGAPRPALDPGRARSQVRYKQTALGVIWVVLQPLIAALIFAFVFGVIAGLPSDGEPYLVFAFAGMTAWNTFANVVNRVSTSLLANGGMLSKIYFPRLILPFSSVISSLVDTVFLAGRDVRDDGSLPGLAGWGIVFLPVWLLILAVLALGLGLMTASWMVRIATLAHVLPVVMQLGMYISPVAWSMTNSKISERFLLVLRLNPLHEPAGGVPVVAFRPWCSPLARSPTLWWWHLWCSGWE